ncbi:hypothetical protein Droror1_Dr00019016 [Drosera rotundifolia]
MANFQLSSLTRGNIGRDDPNPANDELEQEYVRDNLKEKGISRVESTCSEEELFRFSDLDDSNSQETEIFGSGSSVPAGSQSSVHKLLQTVVKEEELNKSGSIDPPSHHVVSAVGEPLFADIVIKAMGELLFRFVFVALG